jgi:Tol biopolymer transport system component
VIRPSSISIVIALLAQVPSLAQTTTRVSVDSAGAQANGPSFRPVITPDGRFVAFESAATNLVPNDTNGKADVFVYDRLLGTTERVSVSSTGAEGNDHSLWFNDNSDPSVSITPDGHYVAFTSFATNLVSGDTNHSADAFVRDRWSGTTVRVSVDSNGAQSVGETYATAISADGRFVAFASTAVFTPNDFNSAFDIFVRDRLLGTTKIVSGGGSQGGSDSAHPSLSADGRYVVFDSNNHNLVPGDSNNTTDVFWRDLQTNLIVCLSVSDVHQQGNSASYGATISSDGRYVAFVSDATNLVPNDTNGVIDVFVRDMVNQTLKRVSVDSAGAQVHGSSYSPSISADGRYVAFVSDATNLVPNDTNGSADVFMHDLLTGETTRVSVDSSGAQADENGFYLYPSISADGRYVAFASVATNLVSGDTNGAEDIFVRDRGDASAFESFCYGDGSAASCPCANDGAPAHGCDNSAATGGARISVTGIASLASDTVQMTSHGELLTALSIVLQGSSAIMPVNFGDGLRCAGGSLKRLYVKTASGGSITAPEASDPSIAAQSSTLGDPIPLGATRVYQVYYRDPNLAFCAGGFNVSSAIAIAWGS